MTSSGLIKGLMSAYLIFALIAAGFVGLMVFEGAINYGGADAAVIIVDYKGDGNYTTIGAALNAANDGDTIRIWAGTYSGNYYINKKINIVGNGSANTIIEGGNDEIGIDIRSNSVNITGISVINNSYSGIYILNVKYVKITNVNCSDNAEGIHIRKSDRVNITGISVINNSDDGIYILRSKNISIANVNSSNNRAGISIRDSENVTIKNSTIRGNQETESGIESYDSNNVTMINNTMESCGIFIRGPELSHWNSHMIDTNNTVNGKPVYYLINQNGGVIPSDAAQLILVNCSNITIENFNFSNATVGIELGFSNNCTIRNNTIINNTGVGLWLFYSDLIRIFNNSFNANEVGLWIYDSDSTEIINNTISFNEVYGIVTIYSDFTTFKNNYLEKNKFVGIAVAGGEYASFTNNTMASCGLDIKENSINDMLTLNFVNNTVNGKPLYFWRNRTGGVVPPGAGQIILVNCSIVLIENQNIDNTTIGIAVYGSNNITIRNNTLYNNAFLCIDLGLAKYSNVYNNTLKRSMYGMFLVAVLTSNVHDNVFNNNENGLYVQHSNYNKIENNTVSSYNEGIEIRYSESNIISNNTFNDNYIGVNLEDDSDNNILTGNNFSNGKNGIYIYRAASNIIDNCSMYNNSYYDIHLRYDSLITTVINSTFNTIYFNQSNSVLIIQNYLHIQVNDLNSTPVMDADVLVTDNNKTVYSTADYGGTDPKTDPRGQVKWILVTDRIYYGSSVPVENITFVEVKYNNFIFSNNSRSVDMSYSHFEYFSLNTIPGKAALVSPTNNSFLNDSKPEFKWNASKDQTGDDLFYYIEVDTWGGDWSSLVAYNRTNLNALNWTLPFSLSDGAYQWRVVANDSYYNGSWSDTYRFIIDTDSPAAGKPYCGSVYNNTGTVNWTWTPSSDTGSGISGYYVYIGTTINGNDIVNGAWMVNDWYELTGLLNGNTYYCRIKAKNGAGTIGAYGLSSNSVLVDLDIPSAFSPTVYSSYNNSGTVKWKWLPSLDTGTGITGYYVYIGTTVNGNDIVDGAWTVNAWYELSSLQNGNSYFCRIKAKNGAGTIGSFSASSIGVTVDLDKPSAPKPTTHGEFNNTGSVKWKWLQPSDTGSGISGYFVYVGSTEGGNDIVDGSWTNMRSFEISDLTDGDTIYCSIKTKNGAGTISDMGPASTGVLMDLDSPTVDKPFTDSAYDNTGIVTWKWNPAGDTGSGITGYYVTITYGINRDIVVNDAWTINSWIEVSNLKDGRIYYCKIRAVNGAGTQGSFGLESEGVIVDLTPPALPSGISATPDTWTSSDMFSVSWTNPADFSGIAGAYYKIDSLPTSNTDGTYLLNDDITSINDLSVGVTGKHTVYIWLRDKAGNEDHNNYVMVDLLFDNTAPDAPLDVNVAPVGWSSVNSFEIGWTTPTDHSGVKNGVYYHIGNGPPISQNSGTWVPGESLTLKNVNEGDTNVYVWHEDNVGNANYLNYSLVILNLDVTGPQIVHEPIKDAVINDDIKISATITDPYSNVGACKLHYKKITDKTYSVLPMLNYGNIYTAIIPDGELSLEGIEYYIEAIDLASPGNVIYFGANGGTKIRPGSSNDIDVIISNTPSIIDYYPSGAGVAVDDKIIIRFSKPIDPDSALGIHVIGMGETIDVEFSWKGSSELILTPFSKLEYNVTHEVFIYRDLKDTDGNHLESNFQWNFTTEKKMEEPDGDKIPDDGKDKNKETEGKGGIYAGIGAIVIIVVILIILFLLMQKKRKNVSADPIPDDKKVPAFIPNNAGEGGQGPGSVNQNYSSDFP